MFLKRENDHSDKTWKYTDCVLIHRLSEQKQTAKNNTHKKHVAYFDVYKG